MTSRWPRHALAAGITVAAVFQTAIMVWSFQAPMMNGIDFMPLRHAGQNLLAGTSVYSDPTFVYPPTAALLLTPLALGTTHAAYTWWVMTGVALNVATGLLIGRAAPRENRVLVSAIAVYTLVGSVCAVQAYQLGQFTMYLTPVAAAIALAVHAGRWRLATSLVAGSLLVKPLLIGLIAVPLLKRRWADLVAALVPALVLLTLALAIVPGGTHIGRFVFYVLHGTNLHGRNAVNNISLAGWVEVHHAAHLVAVLAEVAVVVLVALVVRRRAADPSPVVAVQLLVVAYTTTLLVAGISELHFYLPLLALVLVRLSVAPSARAAATFAPPVTLLALAPSELGISFSDGNNTWFVLIGVLLFAAAVADLRTSAPVARRGDVAISPADRSGHRTGSHPAPAAAAAG